MTSSKILLCTVGGSHQPIVTAIKQTRPDYVMFFCTDRDPGTNRPGSRGQVEGKGMCIKAHVADEKPTLPSIPAQGGVGPAGWEVRIVPADDMDGAYQVMRLAMKEAGARFSGAARYADYTGGTKTMSAALVLAALDEGDVALQLVAGARSDLVRVRDGTQSVADAVVEAVRLDRDMTSVLATWRRYAYEEAAAGLSALNAPRNPRLRGHWQRARDLSVAFAAWDRFDHRGAAAGLSLYAAVLPETWRPYLEATKALCGAESRRRTGLLLWDLWLNALRRAEAGRYDDAVSRAYRLLEWTAQWVLETRVGLKTADLPREIAAPAGISPSHDGRFQAGLFTAWELVAAHAGGEAAHFFKAQRGRMRDCLARRNQSILAHGFTPIAESDWAVMHDWLEQAYIPMLHAELEESRVGRPLPQLPGNYLEETPTS